MEKRLQNEIRVSVCMATYNGKKYIRNQLDTIIDNLTYDDELIISDDGSTDGTLDILQEYEREYKQVVVLKGPGKGVIKNFENALSNSSGKIIFLADQDDEWNQRKVEIVLNQFIKNNIMVVVHDAIIVDGEDNEISVSLFKKRNSRPGLIKNFVKNSYVGCCMAFRREILAYSLPFPQNIEMHDWWIGLISDCRKSSVFIEDKLIRYRRHENNVSSMKHNKVSRMLKTRIVFAFELFVRLINRKNIDNKRC